MNTVKTIVVSALMLAIGYGTHIVLNKQPTGDDPLSDANIWDQNGVELTTVPNSVGNIELPAFTPAPEGVSKNRFAAPAPRENARTNPFANLSSGFDLTPPRADTPLVNVPPLDSAVGSRTGRPDLDIHASAPSLPSLPDVTISPPPTTSTAPSIDLTKPATQSLSASVPSKTPGGAPMNFNEPVGSATASGATTSSNAPIVNAVPTQQTNASFAKTWQTAQAEIGSGKLAGALATLSAIYNDPMDNAQRGQLVSLLDQLAGTVIYSQQHLLHPAYSPRNGETIAQVAARQGVPADFLARVNGINPHMQLNASMPLKVVTGPFRAELSRTRRELTLFLGPHYAGRFAVAVGQNFPSTVTTFEVFEKSGARVYSDPHTGQQLPAGHPSNPYGAHWIGLRSVGLPATQVCGMHSVGSEVDASDSRGGIGLSDDDADDLKAILELGSAVTVVR